MKKIIEEYKDCWPAIAFVLLLVAEIVLMFGPSFVAGYVAYTSFELGKYMSLVAGIITGLIWNIIIAPILRHLFIWQANIH